jgi:hypothetical protein
MISSLNSYRKGCPGSIQPWLSLGNFVGCCLVGRGRSSLGRRFPQRVPQAWLSGCVQTWRIRGGSNGCRSVESAAGLTSELWSWLTLGSANLVMNSIHFPQLIGRSVSCCRIAYTECPRNVFVRHSQRTDWRADRLSAETGRTRRPRAR